MRKYIFGTLFVLIASFFILYMVGGIPLTISMDQEKYVRGKYGEYSVHANGSYMRFALKSCDPEPEVRLFIKDSDAWREIFISVTSDNTCLDGKILVRGETFMPGSCLFNPSISLISERIFAWDGNYLEPTKDSRCPEGAEAFARRFANPGEYKITFGLSEAIFMLE